MTIIYLYVKTHNKTGLKYLGKTVSKDPHAYAGSGKYWKNHLRKHGYDYTTEILQECSSAEELKYWGNYYSKLFDVVESNEWANLMPEVGDGINSEFAKNMWTDPIYREKIAESWSLERKNLQKERMQIQKNTDLWKDNFKTAVNSASYKKNRSISASSQWKDQEFRNKMSEKTSRQWEDLEFRQIVSENTRKTSTERWKDTKFRDTVIDQISGCKHYCYDHTKYNFIHKDGTEEFCTSYELHQKYSYVSKHTIRSVIKGRKKSHKGWSIKY